MSQVSHCVKVEEISPVKKKLFFDIPWADVKDELDSAYKIVGRKARIKGFRPGKTPRKILETYYKEEAEDGAISSIVNKVYWNAIEEANIIPVAQPVIDQKGIETEKNFEFTATVEIKPQIEPKDYLGMEIDKEEIDVSDGDVQSRLERLRHVYSTMEDANEDRGAREGDLVTLDFEGRLDGVSHRDLKAEQYMLEIGTNRFLPGFEEQIIGLKVGEQKEFQLKVSEDYPSKDVAGKEAVFSVTVRGIKEKILPALDESFVRNFEKYQTLDDLKADLRKGLESETGERIRASVRKNIVDRLLEANSFEIPDTFVERQTYSLMMDTHRRLAMNGMDPGKASEIVERMKDRLKSNAERMVRTTLLLESIADRESIQVEEADVEKRLGEIAQNFGQPLEEVKKLYEKEDLMETLRGEIREEKTLDFIEGKAKINLVKRES